MLYQIKDGTVSAGGQTILSHIDFYIKEKEKIAVVGKNGAGKTTLLRLLAGELTPDRDDSRGSYGRSNDMVTGAATAGSDLDGTAKRTQRAKKKKSSGNPETGITMSRNITIDMLRQADKSNQDLTIEQILLESCPDKDTFSKERFDYEMEYDRLFTGFGFEKSDKTRLFRSFSGGEQTKISLIKLLLKKPDLLLLDEPTNHLDMKTVEWLEDYLRRFRGAIIMITHDRYFLDSVCNRIVEVDKGQTYSYDANYSGFLELKAAREESERASERKRQSILRKEIEWMQRGARARSTKQKAHIQRYEALRDQKGPQTDGKVELSSVSSRMGRTTIELHDISKAYGDIVCVKDFTYIFLKNDRIGFVGKNGCGKSTLLKLLMRFWDVNKGNIKISEENLCARRTDLCQHLPCLRGFYSHRSSSTAR